MFHCHQRKAFSPIPFEPRNRASPLCIPSRAGRGRIIHSSKTYTFDKYVSLYHKSYEKKNRLKALYMCITKMNSTMHTLLMDKKLRSHYNTSLLTDAFVFQTLSQPSKIQFPPSTVVYDFREYQQSTMSYDTVHNFLHNYVEYHKEKQSILKQCRWIDDCLSHWNMKFIKDVSTLGPEYGHMIQIHKLVTM